jgi:hypothetical protein
MSPLLLLTGQDCHLCAHGREVMDALASEGMLRWWEVDAESAEGRGLAAAAPPLRPVLFNADGRVVAYGRLSAKRLRRQFSGARRPADSPNRRPSFTRPSPPAQTLAGERTPE